MTIAAYLDAMKERFVTDPIVTSFHVIRERSTLVDGHLRIRSRWPMAASSSFPNICNAPPLVRSR
jgi:hypothetical protein